MTIGRAFGLVAIWLGGAVLVGCVSAQIDDLSSLPAAVERGEKVAILAKRQDALSESETDFMSCLREELRHGKSGLQVMDEDAFRDALFPWFEPRLAPANAKGLPTLMKRVEVEQRLKQLQVRYVVWIQGETESSNEKGSMSCAVGPGGGGCFGMMIWDKNSSYEASIWDLKSRAQVGTIKSQATGTSYVPALILPIPMIARTQGAACDNLGAQLRAAFLGNTPGHRE